MSRYLQLGRVGLLAAVWILSSGCATSATSSAADDNIDRGKVAAINSAAVHAGVQVIWLHYPQKSGQSDTAGS